LHIYCRNVLRQKQSPAHGNIKGTGILLGEDKEHFFFFGGGSCLRYMDIVQYATLLRGGPRDAAVNVDIYHEFGLNSKTTFHTPLFW